MKDSSPDTLRKHAQQYRPGSKIKESRERMDRRWESIKEGWDVSGPRWRIGWGGMDDEGDASPPDRRH